MLCNRYGITGRPVSIWSASQSSLGKYIAWFGIALGSEDQKL